MSAEESKKVLVVDDNESVLMVLEFNIQQAGYTVLTATNGKEALEIAIRESPDVIISDVVMPEMGGIDLCKRLRSFPEFSDMPFIFLTAHGEPKERVVGLKSGADDYMVKPFDIEELITRIDILYDKTKKNGHSNSLSGEFKELSLTDVLQIFEHTKKEGTLFIRNGSKKGGSISFKEGMLTDVTYGDLSGEDAMVEFFLLKDGSFHYKSHALSLNLTAKPISFTMMETIRLIDEKFALEDFIPDKKDQLALKEIPPAGDPDVEAVVQVLQAGIKNLYEIQETSGLSRIRTDIATARLLRDKQIEVIKGEGKRVSSPRSSARPFKILFVFTDEVSASEALKKIAETFNAGISRSIKTGVANFLKVIVSDIILHIFSLRGEKRFSFLWEPMIASSDATVFLVKSAQDIEHLEFFRSRLESGMPFYAVSLEQSHAGGEALRMVSRSEDIKDFFVKLLIEISERSKK